MKLFLGTLFLAVMLLGCSTTPATHTASNSNERNPAACNSGFNRISQ